jgi:hypothetical protein
MTRVRGKRGKLVHATTDLRRSLCNRKVDGFIVEPDSDITCDVCLTIARDCDKETGFN